MPKRSPKPRPDVEIDHLYDVLPVGMCYMDRDLRFVRINAMLARINGRPPEAHIGRTIREVLPSLADVVEPRYQRVMETGEPMVDRLVTGRTPGWAGTALVSYYPLRNARGAVQGVTTIVRDITDQQLEGDALKASEAKYRALIETTDTGFVIVTADGILLDANDKHVRITGRERLSDIIGHSITEWVAPYEHARCAEALARCADGGSVTSLEIDLITSAGETRPVEINGAGFVGSNGPVVMGLIRDIRARKESERALRESEEKYRMLVETADDAIVVTGLDGRLRFHNSAYLTSLGYESGGDVPDDFDHVHPDDRPAVESRWSDLSESIKGTAEYRVRHRDGHWVHRSAKSALIRDAAGEPHAVLTIVRDMTKRIQAEEALRESEARYRTLVEHAPEAVVVLDADSGRFVDCNHNATALYGWSRAELLTMGPVELSPPRQPDGRRSTDAARDYVRRAVDGEVPTFEWLHVNATGEEIPCEVRLVWLPASDRQLIRGSVTDISERKRAEESLRQSQRLESLGVLAGGIAHDFNNLLVGILGNAELVRTDLPSHSASAKLLNGIERAALSASELIRQMLAYSGKTRFEVRPLDLNDLVKEILGLLKTVGAKARMRYDFAVDLPRVDADPSQIQQVVMNLITNAAESLDDDGGHITIRTGTKVIEGAGHAPTYFGEPLEEGRYVFLEVEDTGTGMDRPTQSKMFEPFFTTKFTGRGLGLAALLGIVRGHHGDVRVSSAVGEGTTVRVLLPESTMPEVAAPVVAEDLPAGTAWTGQGTVLVIDDEELVRDVVCQTLDSVGFETVSAVDGREGVDAFRKRSDQVAAVVLDLTMPGQSAGETLRELRDIRPDIKVLVSSGHAEHEASRMLPGAGVAGFLQKPYRPRALVHAIRTVLEG